MNVKIYKISDLPVAQIDNYYSEEECEKIWREIKFLNSNETKMRPPEETDSAWKLDQEGNKIYLKKNNTYNNLLYIKY